MKIGKAFLVALILVAFPAVGFGQRETASRDNNGIRGLLLHDAVNLQTRRWLDDGSGGALVSFGAGASLVADQGISGVSDADPWNVMIRSGAGTELGLAASPFAISIFDAASNLLGVTANPFVVDLGLNNDVLIQATAGSPGSVRLSDGTTFYKATTPSDTQPISAASLPLPTGAATETTLAGIKTGTDKIPASPSTDRTLATAPFATRLTDGTVFYKATTPSDTQPISAASLPLPSGAATGAKQDTGNTSLADIELNTDTATNFAGGNITVTTTATLISAASATRRSVLVHNASTSVVFVGPTGVTTTNGHPLSKSTAAADGLGGTAEFSNTAAVFGIVASGTADIRFISESD